MTGGEILYLTMAVAAFVVFAIALGLISEIEQRNQRRRQELELPAAATPVEPIRKAA